MLRPDRRGGHRPQGRHRFRGRPAGDCLSAVKKSQTDLHPACKGLSWQNVPGHPVTATRHARRAPAPSRSDRKSRRLGELVILFPTGITCVSLASVEKDSKWCVRSLQTGFRAPTACPHVLGPAVGFSVVMGPVAAVDEPLVVPPLLRRRWVTCAGVSRCAHEVRPGLQPATGKSAAVGKQPNSSSGQLWPARSPHSRSTGFSAYYCFRDPGDAKWSMNIFET